MARCVPDCLSSSANTAVTAISVSWCYAPAILWVSQERTTDPALKSGVSGHAVRTCRRFQPPLIEGECDEAATTRERTTARPLLASLQVGSLELDRPSPYAMLSAKDEKNGQGSDPLCLLKHSAAASDRLVKLQRKRRPAETWQQSAITDDKEDSTSGRTTPKNDPCLFSVNLPKRAAAISENSSSSTLCA